GRSFAVRVPRPCSYLPQQLLELPVHGIADAGERVVRAYAPARDAARRRGGLVPGLAHEVAAHELDQLDLPAREVLRPAARDALAEEVARRPFAGDREILPVLDLLQLVDRA